MSSPAGMGGAAFQARDDDGLAHVGQGQLGLQRRGRTAEAGDAGNHLVFDAAGDKLVHLLADGAVDSGVARVQAHQLRTLGIGLYHNRDNFFERHLGAVEDLATGFADFQQLGIDQASRPDYVVSFAKELVTAQGDQVGGAATRAHK